MLGVVVGMLSPLILWAGEGQIRRSPNAVKDEYIVVLNDDTPLARVPELAKQLSKAHGGELERVWGYALKGFFVRMNESQAMGLSHNPHIKYIEENAEMFLSASAPTKVDPSCTPSPCATSDDRLWHLDMLDQTSAIPNNEYRYCSTGSGVYVYVIDTGVVRAHHEFNNDPNRVVDGYDASGDPSWFPAWNPLHGFPSPNMAEPTNLGNIGHGTGVASLVAGKNVGVARDAIIVPVKTWPSARSAALKLEQNKTYVLDQIVYGNGALYKITKAGVTNAPMPGRWPWKDEPCDPVPCPWGEVEYEYMDPQPPIGATVQMVVDGLDWILRPSQPDQNGNLPPGGPGSPYPKTPAVVTLSTYCVVCGAGVTNPTCVTASLEEAIGRLLKYNNGHGITVIASANNQDSNACETSPGRMSRNNPNNPNDPEQPYKVITAGGTMLRNIPDPVSNPASGGSAVSQSEPAYDPSKPTLPARWRCHAGDSDVCAVGIGNGHSTPVNIYSDPPPTIPNPLTSPGDYVGTTLGSNWGRCVTLFAPAKNIQVANDTATNGYRDPRATGAQASGTSWSAPIVAAMAARILQGNPNLDIEGVYNALMSHTTETLDTRELQPAGQTGTPRSVLQLADVAASPLPNTIPKASSGSIAIAVSASATTAIRNYELFRVNSDYDLSLGRFNAAAAVRIATSLSSTFEVNPSVETSYFVRVNTDCGSADTNITTVTIQAPPPAPSGFTATTVSGSVNFGWSPVSGADSYRVERKLPGMSWATAITVSGGSASSASESAPSAPEGVVLYRVRALAASVSSNPSNNDVAWVGSFSDEPVMGQSVTFKGAHIVQMRKAINGLCLAADLPQQYALAEIAATAMNGLFVDDAHFVDLRTRLNAARTNPAVGLPAMSFQTTPAQSSFVLATQIDDLRRGVK